MRSAATVSSAAGERTAPPPRAASWKLGAATSAHSRARGNPGGRGAGRCRRTRGPLFLPALFMRRADVPVRPRTRRRAVEPGSASAPCDPRGTEDSRAQRSARTRAAPPYLSFEALRSSTGIASEVGTAARSTAIMRSCQPGPSFWKWARISWSMRSVTGSRAPGRAPRSVAPRLAEGGFGGGAGVLPAGPAGRGLGHDGMTPRRGDGFHP